MLRLLPLVLLYAIPAITVAQIPANNECANATPITVSTSNACENSVNSTSLNATQSMAPCVGTVANDVWFQFTATNAVQIIQLSSNEIINPVIQVFSGSCGSLTSIVCHSDALVNKQTRRAITGLTIGTTYYIRVYARFPDGSPFTLCIFPPSPNDECTGAIDIPVNTGLTWTSYTAGNNRFNSASGTGCITNNRADGWFKFTAQDSVQLIHMKGTGLHSSYSNMQAYEGSCGSLTQIKAMRWDGPQTNCSYPFGSDGYYSLRGLVPSNTYYVNVIQDISYTSNVNDSFYVAISNVPANDGFTGAQEITVNPGTDCSAKTTGNFRNASPTMNIAYTCGLAFGYGGTDLWYKFTATSSRHLLNVTFLNSILNPIYQVYYLDNGNLQPVTCQIGTNPYFFNDLSSLTPGTVYYIRVRAQGTFFTDNFHELCITTPGTTISNNACSVAQPLTAGQNILASANYANYTPGGPTGCNNSTLALRNQWYTFTSSTSSAAVLQFISPNTGIYEIIEMGIEMYTGTCGTLTKTSCTSITDDVVTTLNFTENAGTTYYVRIYSFTNRDIPFTLSLTENVNLPVTITSFEAGRMTNGTIKLLWKTQEETGIDHYEIERSTNGTQFDQIARMPARNVSAPSEYAEVDQSPLSGISYYRLKIVERDGKIEYSKIVKVSINNDGNFTGNLLVGREGGSIFINNQNTDYKKVTLNIYTATGQRLYSTPKRLIGGVNRISFPGQTNRPLFIQVITEDNEAKTFKIY